MAGSRLDLIGTIFSRMQGLLKSKAIKYQDRPVWYDIYRVFPPKYEPYVEREPLKSVEDIPNILYKEDKVRAQFLKQFGLNPDGKVRKLHDPSFEDPSLDFISKCNDLHQKHGDWTSLQVYSKVAEEYQAERPGRSQEMRKGRGRLEQSAAEDEEGSVSSELLSHPKRAPLVTKESLRSLFEEAKTNQEK